jgi:hypothetical protein
MAEPVRWRPGWDDLVPLAVLAAPMVLLALLVGPRFAVDFLVVVLAVGSGVAVKHLAPPNLVDLSALPLFLALLLELTTVPLTVQSLVLAAMAGVGLLLWTGAEPTMHVALGPRLEPALVPALATGVAVAVMLFLPGGSTGQVGVAALVLVAVLGLAAWLYLRSTLEAAATESTP